MGHGHALPAVRHPRQARRPTCRRWWRSRRPRIVGPRERRLSPRETARLQGLPDWFDFGDQRPAATYKQMGNGVNVGAVWHVLREHVRRDEDVLKRTAAGRRILEAVLDGAAVAGRGARGDGPYAVASTSIDFV